MLTPCRLNIQLIYLDNVLTCEGTYNELRYCNFCTATSRFVINLQKSQLEPSMEVQFMSVTINSIDMTFCLSEVKIKIITKLCKKIRKSYFSHRVFSEMHLPSKTLNFLRNSLHQRLPPLYSIISLIRSKYRHYLWKR